ncbi:MAG TPA: cupredoxin domain-containing protein, partial [Thermomicrobiales bacterium]|nr:cupredoxin domain-containing protein [Thermomicrobiales bacterium]
IAASADESANPTHAVGARFDPLPIGTPARISDDWELTVTGVLPDATEYVLSESEYNDPPESGDQYFIAAVTVRYLGNTSARFSSSRLSSVGQSSVAYEEYEDNCGQLPNELEDREIFSGGIIEGNICWSVSEEDIGSLVLYYTDSDDEDRVFFSLVPSTPIDLLATPTSEPVATVEATPFQFASPESVASPEVVSAVEATPEVTVSTSSITDAIDAAVANAGTPFVKVIPELDAKDIAFVPTEITVDAADEPVTIKMENTGAALHNFSIDSLDISVDVNPGETVDVVIPAGTAPGTYDFYCNVPGHKEAGMVGTLTVE